MTSLYVRNLSLDTTEHEIRTLFNHYSNGEVTKIKLMRDFAFVHFSSREQATKAMKALNGKNFGISYIISLRLLIVGLSFST